MGTSYKNNPRTQLQLSAAVEEYEWVRSFFLYVCPILTAVTVSCIYLYLWPLLDDEYVNRSSFISASILTGNTSSSYSSSIEYGTYYVTLWLTILYRLVLHYPFVSIGNLLLIVLTVASYYGLYWIQQFLPTIFEPCYELRYLPESFTFDELVRSTQKYRKEKGKFMETIYQHTLPVVYPSSVNRQPYYLVPSTASPTNRSTTGTHNSTLLDQRTRYELSITEDSTKRERYLFVVKYSDRLGNHLFQYIYVRLRAMYFDVPFVSSVSLGSPFQYVACFVQRWNTDKDTVKSGSEVVNSSPYGYHEYLLRSRTKVTTDKKSSLADLSTLLASTHFTSVRNLFINEPVCKYAMYIPLYTGFEALIFNWFRPCVDKVYDEQQSKRTLSTELPSISASSAVPVTPVHDNPLIGIVKEPITRFHPTDICIHVRLGDILWGAHASYRPLPMSYYRQSIDHILQQHASSFSSSSPLSLRIIIVTEDASHPIILRMAQTLYDYVHKEYIQSNGKRSAYTLSTTTFSIVIQSQTITDDFLTLTNAPNLVLSISSFVWWAATLNTIATTIIVPECGMFVTHSWQPAPRTHPHVYVRHNLTIPDIRPQRTALSTSLPSFSIQDNITTINSLMQGYSSSSGAKTVQSTDTIVSDFPSVTVRSGVHTVSLLHLERWPGHKKEAIESLFD